nr:ribonuclease H-like domain, reverse transcriptase, RNA-dependent DNA polymerase [Tanacetum cinerariifolium]
LGLWYPKDSPLMLEAFSDSDYTGASLDRKSTTEGRLMMFIYNQEWIKKHVSSDCKDRHLGNFKRGRDTKSNDPPLSRDNTLGSGKDSMKLMEKEKRDTSAKVKKANDEVQIQALVDGKRVNIKESSIRRIMRLDNAEGISFLTNIEIFKGLARMGAKTTSWNEVSSTMASVIICLATNQRFNFSRYIILSLVKNIEAGVPFFMFPREVTLLFDNMLVQDPKEVGILQADAQPILIPTEPLTSKTQKKHKPKRKHTKEPKVPPTESQAEHNVPLPLPSHDPLPSGEDRLKLKELMDLCTNLSNKVLNLESEVIDIKSTYKAKIEKLESKEESSKHGRKIAYIDVDVEINLEKV